MIAIVNIDLSKMPDREKSADMRRAANEFSNDKKSIQVEKYKRKDVYRLETRFSRKTVAQYKVVDQIFHNIIPLRNGLPFGGEEALRILRGGIEKK